MNRVVSTGQRNDVVAVARLGEAPISQIAMDICVSEVIPISRARVAPVRADVNCIPVC